MDDGTINWIDSFDMEIFILRIRNQVESKPRRCQLSATTKQLKNMKALIK